MEWLNELKEKFSIRRIRNLDRTKEYSRDFVDLESAKVVGLIVNTEDSSEEDLALIRTYMDALRHRRKQLLLIEINFKKKSEPILATGEKDIFINPAKLNWLDYPTPGIETQIQKNEIDILMDFDGSDHMTSKYICSMARAKTRTGVHHEGFESCYELMINQHEAGSGVLAMKALIKEFDYFLNMIDNGNKVKA